MPNIFSQSGPDRSYFAKDNVDFIQQKIGDMLAPEYGTRVVYDPESIVRTMQTVYEEKLEHPALMNRRVMMILVREFRNEQSAIAKSLRLQEAFVSSTGIYDPISNKGPDLHAIKLRNRLGRSKVGSTTSFAFI